MKLQLWIAAVLLATPGIAQSADEPKEEKPLTRENVDNYIKARVQSIWARQTSAGHWENVPTGKKAEQVSATGKTALALMGLKAAGVDEQDPRFQKGLAVLNEMSADHTYSRGMRAQLWSMLKDPAYRKLLLKEGDWFLKAIRADGMYSYGPPTGAQEDSKGGDYSNAQYGVLGMWACSDAGYEVPWKYWRLVEENYLRGQTRDGGWHYHQRISGRAKRGAGQRLPEGYGSMTAGGVATMFLIWEKLYVANDRNCAGRVSADLVKSVNAGVEWLGDHFATTHNPLGDGWKRGYTFYYFYGLERVGVASGLKYFGKHDWYREIATAIINGKVSPHADYTRGVSPYGWELMFLCYGRAPVAFNKLKYAGDWNEHPREYAMLCKWLGKTFEEHRNWQIMPIEAPGRDFHDAPILTISGKGRFGFKKDDLDKLRTYLDRGGMIFGEAINNNQAFRLSFGNLCKQLYPHSELVPLDKEHPLYSAHFKLKGTPELMGLSDGIRTTVILSPEEISCDWQRLNLARGKHNFEFGANLVQFASDGGQLWSKEESYWPVDQNKKSAKTVTVGRLMHGGAENTHVWDPTASAGWGRLDIVSRNAGGFGIKTTAVDASREIDPAAVPVLHLTGIGKLNLGENEQLNLKKYVKGGGLLLVDAAGGGEAFDKSFRGQVQAMFGENALTPLPQQPWLGEATDEGKVWYRHLDRLPRVMRALQLLGVNVKDGAADGWNVIYVPNDITYALNGAPASEPVGLSPEAAEKVVLAMLATRAK